MTSDRQPLGVDIAQAVSKLISEKYRSAKVAARALGIYPATAENVHKGNLSVSTLQKIIESEGREFYHKLGDELFGESFAEYEERRLNQIIAEASRAKETIRVLREKREALDKRAALALDAYDRAVDDRKRNRAGDGRGEAR